MATSAGTAGGAPRRRGALGGFEAALDSLPRWYVYLGTAALIPALGSIDLLTGYELSFSLFYLLPVTMAAWFVSRWWGVAVAAASAAAWLAADMAAGHEYSAAWIPYWNAGIRLGFFLSVTTTLASLRAALRRESLSARTDFLTGVANKRAFAERAEVELERSRRYGHPFSIAYLDVDRFKQINDTLGHDAGDRLLRDVGRTLAATLRAPDLVGRLGGDEFGLLLVETAGAQAEATLARVRRALADMTLKEGWKVTFSVGVTTFAQAPPSLREALGLADQLMYAVKKDGRGEIRHAVWQAP